MGISLCLGIFDFLDVDVLGIVAKDAERDRTDPNGAIEAFEAMDFVVTAAEQTALRLYAFVESWMLFAFATRTDIDRHVVAILLLAQTVEHLVAPSHHGEGVAVARPRHIYVPQPVLGYINKAQTILLLSKAKNSLGKDHSDLCILKNVCHKIKRINEKPTPMRSGVGYTFYIYLKDSLYILDSKDPKVLRISGCKVTKKVLDYANRLID